jgi:hypothetical protein
MFAFTGGDGIMCNFAETAFDRRFWQALDRWMSDHDRAPPGDFKLAVSYLEAVFNQRDLKAFWERTLDIPIGVRDEEIWQPTVSKKRRRQ